MATVFSDFLQQLGVPHTQAYADAAFEKMPFKTLFGLGHLLQTYGVRSEGYKLASPADIASLRPPFIAGTRGGLIIVIAVGTDRRVGYLTQGVAETMTMDEFVRVSDGKVFLAYPDEKSAEPDYHEHERDIALTRIKRWCLPVLLAALFLYLFISNGIYSHVSTVLLTLLDFAGLWLTYMLVQKSLRIANPAADRVCSVLQTGGCDNILKLKASKFFGMFGWSEVGFAYFSVSLMCLLVFPQWICYLALCNVCCLPYTFWSIWYQRFRAHSWCTLCVSVQVTLWLSFFCYLGGGWFAGVWPLRIEFFGLGATYVTVLLALNRVLPYFENKEDDDDQI